MIGAPPTIVLHGPDQPLGLLCVCVHAKGNLANSELTRPSHFGSGSRLTRGSDWQMLSQYISLATPFSCTSHKARESASSSSMRRWAGERSSVPSSLSL